MPGDDVGDPMARVTEVLDWLEANRYLSQQRFVESRIHVRAARHGNLRIQQELAQHGIALDAETAQSLKASEVERAREVWARKFDAPSHRRGRARQASAFPDRPRLLGRDGAARAARVGQGRAGRRSRLTGAQPAGCQPGVSFGATQHATLRGVCARIRRGDGPAEVRAVQPPHPPDVVLMALPPAAPERELKHRRSINVQIYARGNGLWEVDAEIVDVKTRDSQARRRPAASR